MKKKVYKVSYTYFWAEGDTSCTSFYVCGTEDESKEFIRKKLSEEESWLKEQVKDFDSNSRTKLYIEELEIINL